MTVSSSLSARGQLTVLTLLLPPFLLQAHHDVQVGVDDKGNSALKYTPPEVHAEVGGECPLPR